MNESQLQRLQQSICENIVDRMAKRFKPLEHRVDTLEQAMHPSDMAAMIDTLESLKARVRELEFEIAKLSNTVEGSDKGTEPLPWR